MTINDLMAELREIRDDVFEMICAYEVEMIKEKNANSDEVSLLALLGMEASNEQRKRIE